MPLPRNAEEQAAARRHKRQDRTTPLLIRDDGLLMPNMPLIRKLPNMRPYTGDPKATLAERQNWLKGIGKKRVVLYSPPPDEPFDLNKADLDSLCAFALDEYGTVLDASKPLDVLREQVFKLSQLPEVENQMQGSASSAPGQVGPDDDGTGGTDGEGSDPDLDSSAHAGNAAPREGHAGGLSQAQANAGQSANAGAGNTAGRRRRAAAAA